MLYCAATAPEGGRLYPVRRARYGRQRFRAAV